MTDTSYKLILLTKNSCREVELTPETEDQFCIGTDPSCTIRYRRDYFFVDFSLELTRTGGSWRLQCSESVYATKDGVLSLQSLDLEHGLSFQILDREGGEVFRCSFLMDFEQVKRSFCREIDLDGIETLTIGGQGEHIVLQDELVGKDTISLVHKGGGWLLSDNRTRYGVACNGALIAGSVLLQEYDFFSLVGYCFFLKGGKLYTDPAPGCEIRVPWRDLQESHSQFRYPDFNRTTRLQYRMPKENIQVLPPSPKKNDRRKSILFSLIPALAALFLSILFQGIIDNGGTAVVYSVCSMVVGIIMSVVTYISDGRQARRDEKKRQTDYNEYIKQKGEQIKDLRQRELDILNQIHIGVEEDLRQIDSFGCRLFERAPADADFLQVYLGRGRIPAPNPVNAPPREFHNTDDPLDRDPEKLVQKNYFLDNAPVTAQLQKDNCLGLVGGEAALDTALRSLTVDLASRHYFHQVKLSYILDDQVGERFADLRWLPHVREDDGPCRYLGWDEEGRKLTLETLYAILSKREAEIDRARAAQAPSPRFVVFIYGGLPLSSHPISQYFEQAGRLGFTFIFLTRYQENLPRGCGEVMLLDDSGNGILIPAANQMDRQDFVPARLEQAQFHAAVMKLAAVQVGEVSLESELPHSISLYDLLGIIAAEDLDLGQRWKESQVFCSIAAPLGVNRKQKTVSLDIGDQAGAHGPHGLVAGTTGSGKSELLQTYILSIASLFHPYDVSFVLIDFKGGGMSNQFKDLPHLLSTITNIDGRDTDRSLASIKAELVQRQTAFSRAGVNHINDYIKLYKAGKVSEPLPHLILIVDESAELRDDFPGFMKELASMARIGRTLGIHLILSTQKPSGVVGGQIWANSRFRLCLKVQTKEDSNEMLKSPLAAEIREPGRTYFQVGSNEIFELFQSAYSGAPVPEAELEQSKIHDIYSVTPWGGRDLVYTNRNRADGEKRVSQLKAMVKYISDYCASQHFERLRCICQPPLPDLLQLENLPQTGEGWGVCVAVGKYDDPEQQRQEPFVLNLGSENVFAAGASQMGKTTFLQSLACALIRKYTPNQVNIYCIDCGNKSLKAFERSAHVGGVVLATEEEKMENLFKLLHRLMAARRDAFAEKGLSTYKAYLEAGFQDIPQVVVLLDNAAAFREYYDKLTDSLLALSREGLGLGISFVITGTHPNAVSYKMMANFSSRIIFTCTDDGEYSSFFGRTRLSPKPVPGRALVMQDKRILECQVAVMGTAKREIDRMNELQPFLDERSQAAAGQRAVRIPMVPDNLLEDTLFRDEPGRFRTNYRLPLGMDYGQIRFEELDLLQTGTFVLTGTDQAGRLGFLRYLLSALNRTIIFSSTEAYILDDDSGCLRETAGYSYVQEYKDSKKEAIACLKELTDGLANRREGLRLKKDTPLWLLVVENKAVLQDINTDPATAKLFLELAKQAQESRMLLLLSNMDNISPTFNPPEVLKRLRNRPQGMSFGDASECQFYEIPPRQKNELGRGSLKFGDCILFRGRQLYRMKTIQHNREAEQA